ncbi:hypothetical protein AVEN_72759-1 [Araneus ventricosus]|uniref:Uncharacterized protein n=1 Tax=Araneus ventricosus TaxID=182803 RepID=A0A4Y2DRN6_ARAVE|nr:hypothetical protein AVEN_72759-1 [Araneus ventricosus]
MPRAGVCHSSLGSVVGGTVGARISVEHCMTFSEISYNVESFKLEIISVGRVSKHVRFLILSSSDKSRTLSTVSPFAIYKGITGVKLKSLPSFPQSESMLTDYSLSDDSDAEDCKDYNSDETIEDIAYDIRTRQLSTSQANSNWRSLPTFKMPGKKNRRRRNS